MLLAIVVSWPAEASVIDLMSQALSVCPGLELMTLTVDSGKVTVKMFLPCLCD